MKPYKLDEKPLANPNPEKAFNNRFHYVDLYLSKFDDLVLKFEDRIKYWYLKPVRDLIKKKIESNSFLIIQTVCVIIDLLSQYWYGSPSSDHNKYKEFLKIIRPSFKSKIIPSLKYYQWDSSKKVWKEKLIADYAEAFYIIFRCGLLHNAMIMDCGRISGKNIVKKSVKLRKWKHGTKKGREIAINPILLLNSLERFFATYIKKLLNPKEEIIRENFAKKFEYDFGVKNSPSS